MIKAGHPAKPVGYLHCNTCGGEPQIGATAEGNLVLECERCSEPVAVFELKQPLRGMRCTTCNEPLGPGHVH